MKNLCCVYLLLLPFAVLAEEGHSTLQSLDLTGDLSGPEPVASCEATLSACKQQCRHTVARAADEQFDEPDVSLTVYISDCEAEAWICNKDC